MSTKLSGLTSATSVADADLLLTTTVADSTSKKITVGAFKNSLRLYTVYADAFTGADMGAQINAAYAALPATGGIIIVPGGSYSFSTPIVLNTAEKFVRLEGAPAGGTKLTYTGGTTTVAITYNVSKAITSGHGIFGLQLVGPDQTGSTVGIQVGGLGADDAKGFAGGIVRDVDVSGFGCNILIGNNCFLVTFENVVSNFGGVLFYQKGGAGAGATNWTVNGANTINSGEEMRCINCTFADAHNAVGGASLARYAVHLQVSGFTDFNFIACSFDDAELYIDFTGGTQNNVHCIGCHFENPGSEPGGAYTGYPFITTLSGATTTSLDITDTTFLQDGTGANASPQFINAGCQVTMKGVSFGRNSGVGAATVTNCVVLQDASTNNVVKFYGCSNFNSAVTNIASYSGGALGFTGGTGSVNGLGISGFINGGGVYAGRTQPRVSALSANSATPALNTDLTDLLQITAQTAAITSFTTNLTGTPLAQQRLAIEVTGTGSVALTFGASFEASTVALPTTTSSTAMLHMDFIWNPATSKWRIITVA